MADTAFQTQYRQEFISGFEQRETLLRKAVTTDAVIKGNTATFLVADSGSSQAVTRGTNGLIPARADNLTQASATLVEWHDLARKTNFNVFASQGDQRRIMQVTTMGVINRKIDQDILGELANATNDTGTAATMSLDLAMYAKVILGNNAVPTDNLFAVISPAAEAYLMQTREFASADYVSRKPFEGSTSGVFNSFMWAGVTWIVHPNLSGAGTSAEKCYMWHRDAIGHAFDKESVQAPVGYNEEHDYSFARCTGYFGSKLLQNAGVAVINHDGSAYAAQ